MVIANRNSLIWCLGKASKGKICQGKLWTKALFADGSGPQAPHRTNCIPTSFLSGWPLPAQWWGRFGGNCGRCSSNLLPGALKGEACFRFWDFNRNVSFSPIYIYIYFKVHKILTKSYDFLIRTYYAALTTVLELLLRSRFYTLWSFLAHIL